MNVVRAPWTSASFLLYSGGLTVLVAVVWLLGTLGDEYGDAAFVGWSLLVLAFLAGCAFSLRRAGQALAAGLFGVSAVAAFTVFFGALEAWFGWLPDEDIFGFNGFHLGLLLLELVLVVASLVALRLFRFPLLVLFAAGASWYFVTDLISGGGGWSALVTIAVGLLLLPIALGVDVGESRPYGFWLHVVAGLTIGGGLLWFWHSGDIDWILVAITALLYIGLADRLARSSWAVFGAIGLLWSTTHFVEKWFGSVDFPFILPLFPFSDLREEPRHDWARPISYAVLGFVFVALGVFLTRRRRALSPAAVAPTAS